MIQERSHFPPIHSRIFPATRKIFQARVSRAAFTAIWTPTPSLKFFIVQPLRSMRLTLTVQMLPAGLKQSAAESRELLHSATSMGTDREKSLLVQARVL